MVSGTNVCSSLVVFISDNRVEFDGLPSRAGQWHAGDTVRISFQFTRLPLSTSEFGLYLIGGWGLVETHLQNAMLSDAADNQGFHVAIFKIPSNMGSNQYRLRFRSDSFMFSMIAESFPFPVSAIGADMNVTPSVGVVADPTAAAGDGIDSTAPSVPFVSPPIAIPTDKNQVSSIIPAAIAGSAAGVASASTADIIANANSTNSDSPSQFSPSDYNLNVVKPPPPPRQVFKLW